MQKNVPVWKKSTRGKNPRIKSARKKVPWNKSPRKKGPHKEGSLGTKVRGKAFSDKGRTGKFTEGSWTSFYFYIDWSHPETSHALKDAQRSPDDPTYSMYTKLWETGVQGPFFRGSLFPGLFSGICIKLQLFITCTFVYFQALAMEME